MRLDGHKPVAKNLKEKQKMEKILGVAIVNGKASAVEIDDDLQSYYKLLEIDIIDIVTMSIGRKNYAIVCDDEGLLKDNPIVSGVGSGLDPRLVGNLFICNSDGGDLTSLTPDDILSIGKRLRKTKQIDPATGDVRTFTVVRCDYPIYESEVENNDTGNN